MKRTSVSKSYGNWISLLAAGALASVLAVFGLALTAPPALAATVTDPIVISDPSSPNQGDGWKWDPAGSAGTLTLKDADIQVYDMQGADAAIVVPDGATIHLQGENTVVCSVDSQSSTDINAAIYCEGDLTITGDASSSASISATGNDNAGLYCEGDLNIENGVELNISTLAEGLFGTFVNGNLVITGNATVATTGGSNGLVVAGSTNITDAALVNLGTEQSGLANTLAASFTGDVVISGTEVKVSGSGMKMWDTASIADSKITIDSDTSTGILAMKGLEITDNSTVSASSSGHVIEVVGNMLVQGSTLRAEGVGTWDTAITVTDGDLTIDSSSVTALGDSADSTKGINLNVTKPGSIAGNLILKGTPSITIEGTDAAIQFASQAEDFQGNHVILDDVNIGATEGGMLSYAERSDAGSFLSIWTYAEGKVSIDDSFGIVGASPRVVIGTENSLLLVNDNGAGATGLENVKAIAADGTAYAAEEWLDGSHVGYYRFPNDLPEGTYTLNFGSGYETAGAAVIEVIDQGPSLFTMDFYTVEVKQADNVRAWMVQPSTGDQVSILEHVLYGAEIQLGAQPNDGYNFVKWEVAGAAPEWETGDAAKAEQMIKVLGASTLTPNVAKAAPAADEGDSDKSGLDSGTGDSDKSVLAKTGDEKGMAAIVAGIIATVAAIAAVTAAAVARNRARR